MLSHAERERYDRQMFIPDFGEAGQEKLKKAKVFIAGNGGLGCPLAIYLAAAGVGTLRIVDNGSVELSNLNRQILHWTEDMGRRKVDSTMGKLPRLNPNVKIETVYDTITESNIAELVGDSSLIVDAMDNLPIRFLLNKTALAKKIPYMYGAVYGFEGRASTIIPGRTVCLGCFCQSYLPQTKFPVLGVTPAVIACIQATEAIKYIVGLGDLLLNRLLIYDGLRMQFVEMELKADPECAYCGSRAHKKIEREEP
jgi:molybdopterin/thiamine biosynthesis adenylyltransferase